MADMVGDRVRALRRALGMRQSELAVRVGVSPAYINLIEHDKRRISKRILPMLAAVLQTPPDTLRPGRAAGRTSSLLEAASAVGVSSLGPMDVTTLTNRAGGWADVILAQKARIDRLEHDAEVQADRIAHDPMVSDTMYEIVSTVASMQSTASILQDADDIEPALRRRFLRNMDTDALRLVEAARSLSDHMGPNEQAGDTSTPMDALHTRFAELGYHFPGLEAGKTADWAVNAYCGDLGPVAQKLALREFQRYGEAAQVLPLADLRAVAARGGATPLTLLRHFQIAPHHLLRRCAALQSIGDWQQPALITCDITGRIGYRQPCDGFTVPKAGSACGLWPLYQALQRPMTFLTTTFTQKRANARQGEAPFTCYAFAHQTWGKDPTLPPLTESLMLIFPLILPGANDSPPTEVGVTCRVCPINGCAARNEPSILANAL